MKQPNTSIRSLVEPVMSPPYESWFFFVDDMPLANWEHPCRYIFVNVKTGDYELLSKRRPPLEEMEELISFCPSEKQQKALSLKSAQQSSLLTNPLGLPSMHNYAVIISGGINKYSNYIRYWNDCSDIYTTLIEEYKYPKDHIYVIMSDGSSPEADRKLLNGTYDSSPLDLDGDGQADIQYAATKTNISSIFTQLGNLLTSEDDLFVFTIDHGGQSNDGNDTYLYLWDGEYMTDSEFGTEINKVNAGHIAVCMGQCYSGGFVNSLKGSNRVIATACSSQEVSWACSDLLHDEFVYHWTSAVRGETPTGTGTNADADNDGKVTMYEAFCYARDNDAYYNSTTQHESPQYSSIIPGVGTGMSLYRPFELSMVGNTVVKVTSTYCVKNLPAGASVVWNIENPNSSVYSFQSDYPVTNQCQITPLAQIAHKSILSAIVIFNNDTIANLQKDVFFHNATLSGGCEQLIVPGSFQPLTSPIIIYKNILTNIYSPNFGGMTCPYLPEISSGSVPAISKSGDYGFLLILNNNLTIPFVSEDGNTSFIIDFFTYANSYSLQLSMDGNNLVVDLSEDVGEIVSAQFAEFKEVANRREWTVDVFSIKDASIKHKAEAKGNRCQIDTSGWKPGTYVVMATVDGKTVSKKINIK